MLNDQITQITQKKKIFVEQSQRYIDILEEKLMNVLFYHYRVQRQTPIRTI